MANSNKRARARQVVETLERPEGISRCQWRGVLALLRAIAEFYPKPYPSQQTLADRVGCDVRSIQRYQAVAVTHGLLLVKADAGKKGDNNTWSKTNRYLIVNPTNCRDSYTTECRTNPTGTSYPPGLGLRPSHSPSEKVLSVAGVSREPEEKSRQVGSTTNPPRPKTPPRRLSAGELVVDSGKRIPLRRHAPPADRERCMEHFASAWREMIENTTSGDHLRDVRPDETKGHYRSYLDSQFFGPKALTPKSGDDVVILIDQFVSEAYRGRIKFKEGQSAWMAFTGAWGRRPEAAAPNDNYVPPQRRT